MSGRPSVLAWRQFCESKNQRLFRGARLSDDRGNSFAGGSSLDNMRNIFDQYRHAENRLTHALISSLNESAPLMKSFAELVRHPMPRGTLPVFRQQYQPGADAELSEEASERLSLPDAWIDDGAEGWALVIECKVRSSIQPAQLAAHKRAARSFSDARVVLISMHLASTQVAANYTCIRWTDVYAWAVKNKADRWARTLSEYMEVAERRLLDEDQELVGSLTTFTGIPFGGEPYAYGEAKRLLHLMMDRLHAIPDLRQELRISRVRAGRAAIRGSAGFDIWDMIPLGKSDQKFTDAPHLTIGIRHNEAIAQLTIPNGVPQPRRIQAVGETFEEFCSVAETFARSVDQLLARDLGCRPFVEVIQRHWPTRASPPIVDGLLEFDPRTLRGDGQVRAQPQWVRAAFELLHERASNMQIAFGVRFPYRSSTTVGSADYLMSVVQAFVATRHIVERWRYSAGRARQP